MFAEVFMRPITLASSAIAAFLLVSAPAWPQQEQKPAQNEKQTAAQNQPASGTQAPAAPEDALAEAARKAREAEKKAPKATKVFDNDNIPTVGEISTVGEAAAPSKAAAPGGSAQGQSTPGTGASGNDEQTWRKKFADLRHKLQQDQAELDIMQRELGVLNVQYYSDPNKEMQQQLSREDIDKKTAAIEAKKKDVDADQQAISDAEDALRKAGGDPGWANPQ
jgi:hypothetical protein